MIQFFILFILYIHVNNLFKPVWTSVGRDVARSQEKNRWFSQSARSAQREMPDLKDV